MKNKDYRKKKGVKELDKCYLCNNKGQIRCTLCRGVICNDCIKNGFCYKCNILEYETVAIQHDNIYKTLQ